MHAKNQKGFTLIEIMIALLIGVFLLGALLTIVQTNRRVFGEQSQLAQMQDNERMAMTMMGDVIQSAGYFPNPVVNTLTTALTAAGPFAVGQSISGTKAPPFDTLSVRYMTADSDGILNCSGGSNSTGGTHVYVNTFSVLNGQLICTREDATQYTLVGGTTAPPTGLDITGMSFLYGVRADPTQPGNNVDTYMDAAQVNAATLWGNVISVQITLTFTNPLYSAANPGPVQPTLQISRVIGVMSQTGPTL